ncbi:MAG: tetratricopeptide repeat protein [Candidatus Brocadiia bacterium]
MRYVFILLVLSLFIVAAGKSVESVADIEQLSRDGKKVEAARAYSKLINAEPENIEAHRGYQNLMREAGDIERVRKEYLARLEANPDSPLYNYLYGRLMEGAELEKAFLQAIKLDKTFFWAYYGLGQFYKDNKKYDQAMKYFEDATKVWPEFLEARHWLAMMAYESGDIDRAIAEWAAVLAKKPGYIDAQLGQAIAYKAKGEYIKALDILEPLMMAKYWKAFEPAIQCYHARANYKPAIQARKQLREMSATIQAIPDQITVDIIRTDKYILIAREFIRSEQNRLEFDVYTWQEEKDKVLDISVRQPDKLLYSSRVRETTLVLLRKEGKSDDGKPLAEEVASYYKMIPSYQRVLADVQEYLKK